MLYEQYSYRLLPWGGGEKPPYKGYILRLRADDTNGIRDLTGNPITNNNVTLGNSLINEGGKSLIFSGTDSYSYLIYHNTQAIAENLDFTISVWVGTTTRKYVQSIIMNYPKIEPYDNLGLGVPFDNVHQILYLGNGLYYYTNTDIPSYPFHLALIRKNNKVKLAINGQFFNEEIDFSHQLIYCNPECQCYIGRETSNDDRYAYFVGSMEDLCVIAGKALWTENFTPPSTYLPDDILNY